MVSSINSTEPTINLPQNENLSHCKILDIKKKCQCVMEALTIEPVVCFYLIAVAMRGPTLNNLLLEMACRVNEGFNDSICDSILTSTHEQKNFTIQNSAVQQHISTMLGWCLPVQSTISILLLLFLGSFSDRHNIRRPFILMPVVGELLASALCIVCVNYKEKWPVETAGAAQYILPAMLGGTPMINMAAFAYVASVSSSDMRIVRMAMLQVCINVGNPIGMMLSGVLFDIIGYIPSLLLCILVLITALFYGIFCVNETTLMEKKIASNTIADVINPQHAIETLKLVKYSKGSQRADIVFILLLNFIITATLSGEGSILFWFTQHSYGWKNTDYAFFTAARNAVNSVALVAAVPIMSKFLQLHDLTIIEASFIDKIVANIICLTYKTSHGLYIGMVVGMLTAAGSSGVRSQSTKCVSENSMGKMQSLLSIVDAIAASIATAVYNQAIYSYTREIYSQAFFLAGVLLYLLGLAIMTWKYLITKTEHTCDVDEYNTKL